MSDISERLSDLEKRVEALESLMSRSGKKVPKGSSSKGPTNAVMTLADGDFFSIPKSVKEAQAEMNRQGFYYSLQSIDATLRRLNGSALTRVGKRGEWKYVIRK